MTWNEYEEEESTAVVVMNMHNKNRTKIIRGVLLGVLVATIFGAVVYFVRTDETDDKAVALVRGLKYSGAKEHTVAIKNPGSPVAKIHLSISAASPISIDGATQGESNHLAVDFKPGEHTIDVTVGDKIMRQVMRVQAGEEYTVFFDVSLKKVHVKALE
jgi:hypothetical protein